MAKTTTCPAGQWSTLVSNVGSGIPKTFRVHLEPVEVDTAVSGEFEEKAAAWIFPRPPRTGPLAAAMTFQRKWINAIYKIRIKPDCDVYATVE